MGTSIDWEEFDERSDFPDTKIKFERPGDKVAGLITQIRVTDFGGKGERTPELWVDTDAGEVSLIASQTNLRRALAHHKPKVGDRIAVVYTGDGQSSRAGFSPPKLFDVSVKPADGTTPTPTSPPADQPTPTASAPDATPVSADSLI